MKILSNNNKCKIINKVKIKDNYLRTSNKDNNKFNKKMQVSILDFGDQNYKEINKAKILNNSSKDDK